MKKFKNYINTLQRIYFKRKKLKEKFGEKRVKNQFYLVKYYIYNKLFFKFLFVGIFTKKFSINLKPETVGYVDSPIGTRISLFLIKLFIKIFKNNKLINKYIPINFIFSLRNIFPRMSIQNPFSNEVLFTNIAEDLGFEVFDEHLTGRKTKYYLKFVY